MKHSICRVILLCAIAISMAACSAPAAQQPSATPAPASTSSLVQLDPSATRPTTAAVSTSDPGTGTPRIIINTDGDARPIDRRLLGTNVPAWLGSDRLSNPLLHSRLAALGPTLLRLPGGSWSNAYSWQACENKDEADGCYWTWAARPSDFISLLRATDQEAMWTVSINGTAKEAAALVAFFNGAVGDEREIGVDVRGRDWKTVGYWARLRAEHGSPEPLPIKLWEVGNEVYGGKAGGGAQCADWGWEDVWTCDGVEYINGVGEGADHHEGYLEFRAAMRAVDPKIFVGAVGVSDPASWSNWGNEVIALAGENLDFYVIHEYGFGSEPPDAQTILAQPQQTWPQVMAALNDAFDRYAGGRRAPIAVTEYNMVAVQDLDNQQLMRRAVNALFIADTIGQMASQGISVANQWDLANGRANNGTDYGLLDSETFARSPQYYAMALWQRFGDELLPVESTLPADTTLSVYAGLAADGTLSLMAINKTAQPISADIYISAAPGRLQGSIDLIEASTLESEAVRFNGSPAPSDDLSSPPPQTIKPFTGSYRQTFPPFSIALIRLTLTT